jgi:hypothetical protein
VSAHNAKQGRPEAFVEENDLDLDPNNPVLTKNAGDAVLGWAQPSGDGRDMEINEAEGCLWPISEWVLGLGDILNPEMLVIAPGRNAIFIEDSEDLILARMYLTNDGGIAGAHVMG